MKQINKQGLLRAVLGVFILTILIVAITPNKIKLEKKETIPSTTVTKKITTYTVNVTNSGFDPKLITVKRGEVVIWMNTTTKKATVNSDDHPTHKLNAFLNLGSFNAKSSVQAYFAEAGTYTYHNELNPSQKGTVIVE